MRLAAAAIWIVAACEQRAPVDSCRAHLHGTWVTPASARWMLLDNGGTLELFPLFDDSVTEGAPRVIDIARDGDKLMGSIKRRYMRRAQTCDARAPITVTACKNDTLQLVLGEVSAPMSFEPCAWAQQPPTRVEVWRRE